MTDFTHLHVHSHYSLLDGLGSPERLLARAKELGMTSLALTDHGAMYGTIEFYEAAQKIGIKPIIGVETYIAPRRYTDKTAQVDTRPYHLVLLAKNYEGYKNLLFLTSEAHTKGYYYKPRVDKHLLKKYASNLIGLSACLAGEVPQIAISGQKERAEKVIREYQDIFGPENFFLELQDHPDIPDQAKANRQIIELAQKLKVPLVATNDVHYILAADRDPHDVLICVQTGKTVNDSDRMTYDGDFSMRSPKDMIATFKDTPEAISNTAKIAKMCHVEIPLGKEILPIYPLPKGETDNEYLEKLCDEGLKKRYGDKVEPHRLKARPSDIPSVGGITPDIKERLAYELATIAKMGFASYFLIVQDFVNYGKSHGVPVGPGRGSAAGSIVTYLLNVTDLDPLEYGLLFERFLNPDRIEMPDIDIDFADSKRHIVLDYVRQKYGDDHVAGIITFGTMAARAAVRDTGRGLGMSYAEVDRIAKLVPPPAQGRHIPIEKSIKESVELREVYEKEPAAKRLLDMAKNLEGTVRHASQHACAIVISREPLTTYLPLQPAQKGDVAHVTQYSMGPVSHIGLLKMDFLGLANLSIIGRALDIIEAVWGEKIDIHDLKLDDKQTFKLLGNGQTTGVFQLESSGMKRYIKELKPTCLEDITAMVALYRPGPLQFIDSFIKRKHGQEPITYPHPLVENALKDTYGIPVYQEQVMQIARDLALFTGGEADTLRKAMGKKIAKLMSEMKLKFIQGAVKNGVPEAKAQQVFKMLEDFAAYGFNKSHAACYALIAYQTAYLKAHYPAAFMAALMTSELHDTERIGVIIEETEKMGLKVLPPDINESFVDFGVALPQGVTPPINDAKNAPHIIRFGLAAIKNVGLGVAEAIVRERKAHGRYTSLANFVSRLSSDVGGQSSVVERQTTNDKRQTTGASIAINKKTIEALAKSGGLDSLVERNQCLANMETILRFAGQKSKMSTNQAALFETVGLKMPEEALKLEASEPAPDKQRLAWEKELLGIYLSEHPLKDLGDYIARNALPIGQIDRHMEGKKATIIGIVSTIKKINTKKGQPMAFVGLEDLTGSTEVIVFPKLLESAADCWRADTILRIKGAVSTKDNATKILADEAQMLDTDKLEEFEEINLDNEVVEVKSQNAKFKSSSQNSKLSDGEKNPKSSPKEYSITLPRGAKKDLLIRLKETLQKHPGNVTVVLIIPQNGNLERVITKTQVQPSNDLNNKIEKLLRNIS
jgi:DNA polymerase-3 subunit alpha